MQVGDQPPAEPRTHTFFHSFEVGRRLVGGDHNLAVLIDQRVESVEKLLLGGLLAADKLDVVYHQQIHRAKLFFEVHCRFESQGSNKLIHEFFGGQINDLTVVGVLAHVPSHSVH